MKLGLTSSTRRSEQVLVHAEAALNARAAAEPPSETVRRGRKGGTRLPSGAIDMALSPSLPPRSPAASKLADRAPRKERSAVDSKRRILEAAESEFAAKGFDGARLGTIARAAEVQQALIHHYFGDKEGLHGEVVRSGLAAMTEGVWEILSRMDAPAGASTTRTKAKTTKAGATKAKPAKATSVNDLRTLAEAFVELLLKFFATNGSFLAILRHEARRDGDGAAKIVHGSVGPIFDGIVARLDAMRARGDVKKDVDARHLVLSCVAMVAFPFQEEPFVKAIWPADWHGEAFLEERKRHIVAMILARVAP